MLQLSAHKGPTEDTSLAKNDGLKGQKGSRDAKKMDPMPQCATGYPPPRVSKPKLPRIIAEVIQPPAQRMEDPFNHDEFSDSDYFSRHTCGLKDGARPAKAGGGGNKFPVDGGGSNKAGGKDTKTGFVKGESAPTSVNHSSQGRMGNVASVPTVAVHSPMVGMLPEQVAAAAHSSTWR